MKEVGNRQWYVLCAKGSIRRIEKQFNAISALRQRRGDPSVEYFMPTCIERSSLFGTPTIRRKKLMGNYIFVKDTYPNILEMKKMVDSFWLLTHPDHSLSEPRYMTIGDAEMVVFMAIARAYANELPCYPIDLVNQEEGDKVQVVGGEFDGMCGTLQCSQGRNGGKVLMAIGDIFVVVSPEISPQYIRILQFGKGNRHPYHKFEAHLTRALLALRHLRGIGIRQCGLTTEDIAAMTVFTNRFRALIPSTVNIASQHAALMLMSYVVLGEREEINSWYEQCKRILPKVKSDTQRAWQLTFMYAATGNESLRTQAQLIVDNWTIAPNDRKRLLISSTLNEFTS